MPIALLASCSFVVQPHYVRHNRTAMMAPILVDIVLTAVAFGAARSFVIDSDRKQAACAANANAQNMAMNGSGFNLNFNFNFCWPDSQDMSMAAGAVMAASAFATSAIYGALNIKRTSYAPSDLTWRVLAAQRAGDCRGADVAAAELETIDSDAYLQLAAEPGTQACIHRGCAERRHAVFDAARAAPTQDERIEILRDLPRCRE